MIITLTTDFGYKDGFAGIMKGVIAGINPQAQVVDLSHGVPPQDITSAALLLRYSVPYFPRGTIHVVVVDPGVGSERRPILIEAGADYLIGPDNGVLSLAAAAAPTARVIHLTNSEYHRPEVGNTFHGRDVFAPVAAHVSLGTPPESLGQPVHDFVQLTWPPVTVTETAVRGKIVYIDGFGNLFTNIREQDLVGLPRAKLAFELGGVTIQGLADHYAAAGPGTLVALINSWKLLELAVYGGSAQQRCGARIGDQVIARDLTAKERR
jgi:S-adenosylmethionine hydrolase